MPENEKEKYRTRIIRKAKKIPPPEPFRIRKPAREVKIAPPPEPKRKKKEDKE